MPSLNAILLSAWIIFLAVPASATEPKTSDASNQTVQERNSTQRSSVVQQNDTSAAQEWNLTPQEWQHYKSLMQGSRGVYSPGLDPLSALGIEAHSDEERRHFAELQVQAEAQRVQKELAYNQAYQEAWNRLYPNLQPIQDPDAAPLTSKAVRGNGRLAVFVKDDCPACTERVRSLQAQQQDFDLYMVGSQGDDARIRRWAVLAGIDADRVRNRQITLNHDAGRWLGLSLGGELPAAVREVNGQWLRQ